jgi:hypothetical protein
MATGEVGAMYILLNIPYIYPIFSLKKNPIFLHDFGQKWLDTLLVLFVKKN